MKGLLASEWLKLRSVPSTYYVFAAVAAAVVLAAAVAWNAASIWDGLTAEQRRHFTVAPLASLTSWIVSLCLAVLGVLAITAEYATGTIRATFIAAPRRRTVLAAKAAVIAALGLIAGMAVSFGTFFVSRVVIGGRPFGDQLLVLHDEIPMLLAMGPATAMFGLLGLGLGALTRSTAASLVLVVVLWHVLPIVAQALPPSWYDTVGSLVPSALAGQLAATGNRNSVYGSWLAPFEAGIVMAAYAFVPLVTAAALVERRSA